MDFFETQCIKFLCCKLECTVGKLSPWLSLRRLCPVFLDGGMKMYLYRTYTYRTYRRTYRNNKTVSHSACMLYMCADVSQKTQWGSHLSRICFWKKNSNKEKRCYNLRPTVRVTQHYDRPSLQNSVTVLLSGLSAVLFVFIWFLTLRWVFLCFVLFFTLINPCIFRGLVAAHVHRVTRDVMVLLLPLPMLMLRLCSELLGSVFLMLLSTSASVDRSVWSVEGHPRCAVYFVRYV